MFVLGSVFPFVGTRRPYRRAMKGTRRSNEVGEVTDRERPAVGFTADQLRRPWNPGGGETTSLCTVRRMAAPLRSLAMHSFF